MRVTHPFHPLAGQEFEFVKRRKNWRADRVYIYDAADELVSLPAEWTDVVAAVPFVVVSAGRSPFRVADLLELSELVGDALGMRVERPGAGQRVGLGVPCSLGHRISSQRLSIGLCLLLGGRWWISTGR